MHVYSSATKTLKRSGLIVLCATAESIQYDVAESVFVWLHFLLVFLDCVMGQGCGICGGLAAVLFDCRSLADQWKGGSLVGAEGILNAPGDLGHPKLSG